MPNIKALHSKFAINMQDLWGIKTAYQRVRKVPMLSIYFNSQHYIALLYQVPEIGTLLHQVPKIDFNYSNTCRSTCVID